MKPPLIALTFTSLALLRIASASELTPYSANCKASGGFYGNFQAQEVEGGGFLIEAHQGFSYQLLETLFGAGGRASGGIQLTFTPDQCVKGLGSPEALRCQGRTSLRYSEFSRVGRRDLEHPTIATVTLEPLLHRSHSVIISLSDAHPLVSASEMFDFIRSDFSEREGCTFGAGVDSDI